MIDEQKEKSGCSHLVICPTMHRPEDVSWDRYLVYNTTWSLLDAIYRHNNRETELPASDHPSSWSPIHSVLVPSLGTGTGKVPYERFASQFALAVKNFDEALRSPEKWAAMEWGQINMIENELVRTCK